MTDKPQEVDGARVKPVPDEFVGAVMPGGRGMETHGVPFSGAPELVDEIEMGDPVVVDEPKPEPTPIPVRIVTEGPTERRAFRMYRTYAPLGGPPAQVVGLNENRTKVKIQNMHTETVWLSHEASTASPTFGFPLLAGAAFETTAETPVFAMVATGTEQAPLAVFHEYSVRT